MFRLPMDRGLWVALLVWVSLLWPLCRATDVALPKKHGAPFKRVIAMYEVSYLQSMYF